jgi:hypothetical protein
MIFRPHTLAITLAVLLVCGCASRPSTDAGEWGGDEAAANRLAARFDELRRDERIPGLAVVILRDTTVVLARGFGVADLERQIPVTPETPFNIASVSKPISAVVALRLAQDGALDLDRPMRRYQGFAGSTRSARKGIFFSDYACEGDQLTLRHVLSDGNGGPGPLLVNPPSYSWASRPMAEVTGAVGSMMDRFPTAATLHRRINRRRRPPTSPRCSRRPTAPGGRLALHPPPQGDGAAGVIASAMDLARVTSPSDTIKCFRPVAEKLWIPSRTWADTAYGLRMVSRRLQGRRLAWHTGLWEGQYSALYLKVLNERTPSASPHPLLANSDGLQWKARLDEAAIERSPFAVAFLAALSSPPLDSPR